MDEAGRVLQETMGLTWPAVETAALGGWQLRASGGFTNRANALLPLRPPGLPLPRAVDRAQRWYAARGLPLRVVLSAAQDGDPVDCALGAELVRRGARAHSPTHVMVAPTSRVLARLGVGHAAEGVPAQVGPTPTPAWLHAYGRSRDLAPGWAGRVLTGSPGQLFAHVADPRGGPHLAVARLGIARGQGGLAAVWVDPDHRRAGLAHAVTAALVRAAGPRVADGLHLQVETANPGARSLYTALGFRVHHDDVYLSLPGD